ncbi:Oidioi.mRNA.OKI2018_I69.chr1.g1231.t1.cds [Oikopleura dioica]|uniref:Cleavage and polyadenylation specificity factor subunit 2 n=1 Tax=Oikopleura dioica TaxID=34765 RepID=A0ABN7SUC5_OIKDI|nr:Oidioi.mRNA.OKI2018_I69.chr1.g1231.t1.cds [Oikopleura dioica]
MKWGEMINPDDYKTHELIPESDPSNDDLAGKEQSVTFGRHNPKKKAEEEEKMPTKCIKSREQHHEFIDATKESFIYQLKSKDSLLSNLNFVRVGSKDIEVARIRGRVPGRLELQEESDEPRKLEIDDIPTLQPVSNTYSSGHDTFFIKDTKLTDLKSKLIPTDATTNPSLVLAAMKLEDNFYDKHIEAAAEYAKKAEGDDKLAIPALDQCLATWTVTIRSFEYELEKELDRYGKIIDLILIRRCPTVCFIVYKHSNDARNAARKLHNLSIWSTRLRAELAKPSGKSRGRSRSPRRRRSRSPRRRSFSGIEDVDAQDHTLEDGLTHGAAQDRHSVLSITISSGPILCLEETLSKLHKSLFDFSESLPQQMKYAQHSAAIKPAFTRLIYRVF